MNLKINCAECDRCGAKGDLTRLEGEDTTANRWLYPSGWVVVGQDHDILRFCSIECARPRLEKLHADAWCDLHGKGHTGNVALCVLDNNGYQAWTWMTSRLRVGGQVDIDGKIYKIRGVEHFMTGSMRPHEKVGILVEGLPS